MLETGIDEIQARNEVLSADLRDRLKAEGYSLHQSPDRTERSALVLIEHPDAAGAVAGLPEGPPFRKGQTEIDQFQSFCGRIANKVARAKPEFIFCFFLSPTKAGWLQT